MSLATRRLHYWRRTLQVTGGLLGFWLLVTLLAGLWAPEQTWSLFGWPVGYWLVSQGALVAYCVIVWVYAAVMDRLDQAYSEQPQTD